MRLPTRYFVAQIYLLPMCIQNLLIVFAQGRVPLSRFLNLINNVCAYARLSVARVLLNSVNYNCARIRISIAHFWTYILLRILDLSIVAHFGP